MLATLRCTNTSPGSRPVIWLAGTRLSEQPIHMYLGVCCLTQAGEEAGARRAPSARPRRGCGRRGRWMEVMALLWRSRAHIVSANSSRPISMRRISLVPAPISYSLASRHRRPSG